MEKETPRPIYLIRADPNDCSKLIINPEALQIILDTQGPISILSICGQQKSGKSFLINSLFFAGKGFEVSSTIEQCTKGIMLWSQPISGKGNKGNIWVLDTQGFGSTNEDSNYDGKIFLLTALLSSTLMYNSYGPIDQNALQKFILMCQSSNIIDSNLSQNQLYWILRDFSLAMQNKEGCPLTPDQYLQNSLQATKTESIISKIFSERHCVPLIRPTISEQKLNKLQNTDLKQLRPQFVDQIYKLRKKLINSIQPKTLNKQQLNGQSYVFLIKNVVEQINKGRVECNLNTSWVQISSHQYEKVLQKILKDVKDKVQHMKKVLPLSKQDISRLRKQSISNSIDTYRKKLKGFTLSHQMSEEKIRQAISLLINDLEKENQNHLRNQIKGILNFQINETTNRLKNILSIANFPNKYFQQLYFIKDCLKSKFGSQKEWQILYYEAVTEASIDILQEFGEKLKKFDSGKQKKYDNLRVDYKKMQKQFKQLKKSSEQIKKRSQTQIQENRAQKDQIIKQLTKSKNQLEALYKKLSKQSQQEIKRLEQFLKDKDHQFGQLEHKKQMIEIVHNENLKLLKSKNQMLQILLRDQQEKIRSTANSVDQLHAEYQHKVKLCNQEKNRQISQLSSTISQLQQRIHDEKTRLRELSQQSKQQEQQLLSELANKNQQIFDLRRQITLQQDSLTSNFQIILNNQRVKNQQKVNELYQLCQTYQRKIQLYQMKLEEEISKTQKLQSYDQKVAQLEKKVNCLTLQVEELKQDIEKKTQQAENQKKSHQKFYNHMKENFELQIETLQQQIVKIKKSKQNQIDQLKGQILRLSQQISNLQQENSSKIKKKSKQLEEFYQSQIQQNEAFNQKQINLLKNEIEQYLLQIEQISNEKMKLCKQKQGLFSDIQQMRSKNLSPCKQCSFRDIELKRHKQQYNVCLSRLQVMQGQFEKIKYQHKSSQQALYQAQHETSNIKQKITVMNQQKINQKNFYSQKIQMMEKQNHRLSQQLLKIKSKLIMEQRQKSNKINELSLKADISSKKQEMYKENLNLYKETIQKIRTENSQLRSKIQEKVISSSKLFVRENETPIQVKFQQSFIYSKFKQTVTAQDIDSLKIQHQNKIEQLEQQSHKIRKMLEQQQKFNEQKKKSAKLVNIQVDQKGHELQQIRKQNKQLRKQIQAYLQRQIDSMESKKVIRNNQNQIINRNIDIDQSRIKSLRDQLENSNKKYQAKIKLYDQKLQQIQHQKYLLKQQIIMLKSQLDRRGHYNQKILEQEIQMLKKQRASYEEMSIRKIQSLHESNVSKTQQADRKIAQTQLKYKKIRNQYEKQVSKLQLQNQKHRSKYQNLLKINNQLIHQIQSLRKKPTDAMQFVDQDMNIPTTDNYTNSSSHLKQKYSKKIAELFK